MYIPTIPTRVSLDRSWSPTTLLSQNDFLKKQLNSNFSIFYYHTKKSHLLPYYYFIYLRGRYFLLAQKKLFYNRFWLDQDILFGMYIILCMSMSYIIIPLKNSIPSLTIFVEHFLYVSHVLSTMKIYIQYIGTISTYQKNM